METIGLTIAHTLSFIAADRFFTHKINLDGVYYLMHFIHNCMIVYLTFPDLIHVLTNFGTYYPINTNALSLVFGLHFYHIITYWNKLRFDDWLHHILMIGIALPLGSIVPSHGLMAYSLFFTTGLPGGIDYLLLFLTKNGKLSRRIEKKVNAWLNVWIRSPGCCSMAGLTVAYAFQYYDIGSFYWYAGLLTAFLNYWNGQYFMRQVVENAVLITEN